MRQRTDQRLVKGVLPVRTLVAVLLVMWPAYGLAQAVHPPAEPLTLRTALQFASEHYPSIRAALEQTAAATAQIRVAESAYLPRLDAVWQANRATTNNVFGQVLPQSVIPSMSGPVLADASGSTVWGSAVGALLSWEPVDLGLRAASVHEAQAGVAQARANESVMRLAVQASVGAAFLAVAQADRSVVAAEADVARRDVLARAAHVLADNELRPGADASRADAERAGALTRAIRARQAAAVSRVEFARLPPSNRWCARPRTNIRRFAPGSRLSTCRERTSPFSTRPIAHGSCCSRRSLRVEPAPARTASSKAACLASHQIV